MKKLASTWYNMTIVLTLISVVAGAALAYVNDLTAGPIRMIKEQELQDGIKAVLSADDLTVESTDEADGVIVYRTERRDRLPHRQRYGRAGHGPQRLRRQTDRAGGF